jgi:chromosome segregation ATPase
MRSETSLAHVLPDMPGSPVPSSPAKLQAAQTASEEEYERLLSELALLEDDSRRIKLKLDGPELRGQKQEVLALKEQLRQRKDEMTMLEERQQSINSLFRSVHETKEELKNLGAEEATLRDEVYRLEHEVRQLDGSSSSQVENAEDIAKALSQANSSEELAYLEEELNKCIEQADISSRQLAKLKSDAAIRVREADGKQWQLQQRTSDAEALEADAAARAKELPVIVASMEATASGLAEAEYELDQKSSAIEQVEREMRQRIEANAGSITYIKDLTAQTEKRVNMEQRNRARMNITMKPDENLAAALAKVRAYNTGRPMPGSETLPNAPEISCRPPR